MAIEKELLDQLLTGRDPHDLFFKDGLIDEFKKAFSERMLVAELDDHLESEEVGATNRRNGTWKKTMLTGSSKVTLDIPRDRSGTFDPVLVAAHVEQLRRARTGCNGLIHLKGHAQTAQLVDQPRERDARVAEDRSPNPVRWSFPVTKPVTKWAVRSSPRQSSGAIRSSG